MTNYKKQYLRLFNAITTALKEIEKQNFGFAADLLKQAQIATEEAYLSDESNESLPE